MRPHPRLSYFVSEGKLMAEGSANVHNIIASL